MAHLDRSGRPSSDPTNRLDTTRSSDAEVVRALSRTAITHAQILEAVDKRMKELESLSVRNHNLLVQVLKAIESS